jgi:hypothetical protein
MTEGQGIGRSLVRAAVYGAATIVLATGITMAMAADDVYGRGYLGPLLIVVLTSAITFIVSGPGARHPNRFHALALATLIVSIAVAAFVVRDRYVGCRSTSPAPCDPRIDWQVGPRLVILGLGTGAGVILAAIGGVRSRRSSST